MSAVLPQPDARANKNQTVILQGLATVTQTKVAEVMGLSESVVSRMKDKEVPEFARFLSACKVKVVPQDFRCVSPEYLSGLETFAGLWLKHVAEQKAKGADSGLTWD